LQFQGCFARWIVYATHKHHSPQRTFVSLEEAPCTKPGSDEPLCALQKLYIHETKSMELKPKINKKSRSNLGTAVSTPLTAENNYATKSPLITMGCPTFNYLHPNLIHPSLVRPHSPSQTGSRCNQPFFHNSPIIKNNRQTDRLTNRWARRQLC